MTQLSIFGSGRGSNAEAICDYFKNHPQIKISLIVSDKPDAGILDVAKKFNVDSVVIDSRIKPDSSELIKILRKYSVDYIILAGYLKLIPSALIENYPRRILNIHPALLPAFGGKGMYGMKVHEAVYASQQSETGITIHIVDEEYDRGDIIFRKPVRLQSSDSPAVISAKVRELEHKYYPEIIENYILNPRQKS